MTKTRRKTMQGLYVLCQKLIAGPLVARPLPLLPTDGPGLAMLPDRVRQALRRLPQLAVAAVAGVLLWLSWGSYRDSFSDHLLGAGQRGVLLGLVTAVPLLLVLFRPIAAWWLSLAGVYMAAASHLSHNTLLFGGTTFASHLTVTVLVALGSRPVVAAVMWLSTVAVGFAAAQLFHPGPLAQREVAVFAFWSAIALTGAVLVRAWLVRCPRTLAGWGFGLVVAGGLWLVASSLLAT